MTAERHMKLQMRVLKKALDFADYAKTDSDKWLRRGIAELDFDPIHFLATGNTLPAGWATT